MAAYSRNRTESHTSSIEASPIGPAILKLAAAHAVWHGRAGELLAALSDEQYSTDDDRHRRDWPRSPTAIGNAIRRIAPALRASGLSIDFGSEGHQKRRFIHIADCEGKQVSAVSAASANQPDGAESHVDADTCGHLGADRKSGDSDSGTPNADTADTPLQDLSICDADRRDDLDDEPTPAEAKILGLPDGLETMPPDDAEPRGDSADEPPYASYATAGLREPFGREPRPGNCSRKDQPMPCDYA